MKTFALPLSAVAALCLVTLGVLPVRAQEVKWVASYGDNANPCTRALPCATFFAAYTIIALLLPGGEIRCADSGSFGTIFIQKSLTIDCEDNIGSTTEIGINVAAIDVVTLKGLDI